MGIAVIHHCISDHNKGLRTAPYVEGCKNGIFYLVSLKTK